MNITYRSAITTDAEAAIFSIKSFAGAMLAYYTALSIGLLQPVWAVTTVYLLSQPLAGAVLSKALYRFAGTVLGGAAAVVLLPAFVNEPLVLSFVLALWLGLCVYVTQLDRTPRSYTFLLAGYTASIIGFPSVMSPGNIFNTAILRVQEIGIGIAAASIMQGLVLPRTVTKRLRQQVAGIVGNAEQWSRRALAGARDPALDRERRRLANQINDVEQLTHHVAFDTERLLPRAETVRALQDQLSWLLPVEGVVEDRIADCMALDGGLSPDIGALLQRIELWLAAGIAGPARDEIAQALTAQAEAIEEEIDSRVPWSWSDILEVTLLARLGDLVRVHRTIRELQERIVSGRILGLSRESAQLIQSARGRSLHRDHGLALRSSLGSVVAVFGVCAFWIMTQWPSGATAALIVGVACALFSGLPNPGLTVRRFFYGSLIGVCIAAGYGFAILPRVTDFDLLSAVFAPVFLLLGCLFARPPLTVIALGILLGFTNTVGIASTYQSDFTAFVNGAFAQLSVTLVGVVVIDIFQVVGAERAFSRLYRMGLRDIAARTDGKARNAGRWISRMIDRIALIGARLGPTGAHPAQPPYDALIGMRIGYLAGELREVSVGLAPSENRAAVQEVLAGISSHFRRVGLARHETAGEAVLRAIDRALSAFAVEARSEQRLRNVVLLAGLRQLLFPGAHAFESASHDR